MYAPPLPVQKIHHIEMVVGNAKQASYYYRNCLGFDQIAYAGPETGVRDRASYVIAQGHTRIVLTTPLNPETEMAELLKQHGDGVYDVAFEVPDADIAYFSAVERGAVSIMEPKSIGDDKNGTIRKSTIGTFGDTVHSFLTKNGYRGVFLPTYEPWEVKGKNVGLKFVDHVVGNVEENCMGQWVDWYAKVLGFHQFQTFEDKDISTEYSALRSTVMASADETVKMPINEPAPGRIKSQIQEYVEAYNGPGVQHIALLTGNIIETISSLKEQGMEFLQVPDTYYEHLLERVGPIEEELETLGKLGILVDRDDRGYLLQLFTKPVEDRPTLFFEVIQRKGCQGFGKGNFRALFEAIEREQRRRGNI